MLKESALLFSLYKRQPVLCKDVYCCTVYKSLWIIHRIGERQTGRQTDRQALTDRESVCLYTCLVLLTVKRFRTKFNGFSWSSLTPLFMALAAICQPVGSQVQLPLVLPIGDNSPTTYGLQCSSLKTWVIFTQDVQCIKYNVCFYYFKI